MKYLLLISRSVKENRAAFLKNGMLDNVFIERLMERSSVGSIFLGKIQRIVPGTRDGFVNIGVEHFAFLGQTNVSYNEQLPNSAEAREVKRLLHEGQYLTVQVVKDPIGTKGARLTTSISLAGRSLVYLPNDPYIGVSRHIEDEEHRRALRRQLMALRAKDDKGGYIVRSAVEGDAAEVFRRDMASLRKTWRQIQRKAQEAKKPTLLYEEPSLAERLLRDRFVHGQTEVLVDDPNTLNKLRQFAEQFVPEAVDHLRWYSGDQPLFERYGVEAEIARALSRRVDLESGGYLVIDQTEAMTTVDVNTGSCIGKPRTKDPVLQTNLEAAREIARQLRIRNLGGMIIVDFINMNSTEHQAIVREELKKAAASDPVQVTVSGFNELGLVAMTRKRTSESLSHVLCEPCPLCGGRGEIKTARTVCYDVMRKVTHLSKTHGDKQRLRVIVSSSVAATLQGEESQAFELLKTALGCEVLLDVRPGFTQEQWDVVLA